MRQQAFFNGENRPIPSILNDLGSTAIHTHPPASVFARSSVIAAKNDAAIVRSSLGSDACSLRFRSQFANDRTPFVMVMR
jgi:hypothetical protein